MAYVFNKQAIIPFNLLGFKEEVDVTSLRLTAYCAGYIILSPPLGAFLTKLREKPPEAGQLSSLLLRALESW